MAFNTFGQNPPTTPATTSQLTTGIATPSLFSSVSGQQNVSFGTPVTNSTFGSSSVTNQSTPIKPTFGSNTSLFGGSPNVTVSQSSLSFGGNAALTSPFSTTVDQSKSTLGASAFSPNVTTTTVSAPTASSTTLQSGLTFSTPATTTLQSGLTFSTPTTTSSASLFGSLLKSTPSATSAGIASVTTQPTSFSVAPLTSASSGLVSAFGTIATSQPLLFGVTKQDTPTSQTQPTSTGLATFPTTTSSSLFLTLSTTATSAPATTSRIFGIPPATTSAAAVPGVFLWQKTTSEPTSVTGTSSIGLGGVDHSAVTTTQSSLNTIVAVKEQHLPTEIQQTVVAFKEHVKKQKNLSSEVARSSAEPLSKLTQQIGSLNNLILTLGSILSQQRFTAEKIKFETIKSLNDYELAQKIKDSPVASEERMLSIRKYFSEKISAFEESTKILQEKIEYVYQHVITLAQENSLSAEALKVIVKKLHDSFVVVGARAYKLHNDMQLLKVQYLTLRNQYVRDNSAIPFSTTREVQLPQDGLQAKPSANLSFEGPNPFSRTGSVSFNPLLLTSQNKNFASNNTTKEWNFGLSSVSTPFNFTDYSNSSAFDQNASALTTGQQFPLQKPPSGSKRGKR